MFVLPSGQKARYSMQWDFDDVDGNKSIVNKVMNYIFADKIHHIKKIAHVPQTNKNSTAPDAGASHPAEIGDSISFSYILTQEDKTVSTGNQDNYVLQKGDDLSQFLLLMKENEKKVIFLHNDNKLPDFIFIKDRSVTLEIEIKVIQKINNI